MTAGISFRLGRAIRTVGGAAAICVAASALQADTVTQAMINAYNHSGLLEQNRALLRAADEDVGIATAALRPIIGWTANIKRDFSRFASSATGGVAANSVSNSSTVAISAELLLFDHGASRFAIDAAKESVLATRQELISAEQSVLLRAVTAHLNVRREVETVALRQSNVRVLIQELRAARDRFEVGEITRTDVAYAESRLAASRSALAVSEGALISAQEEYRAATGKKPGRLTAPKHVPQTAKSMDAAKDIAVRNHPEMLAIQHNVSAADLNVMRAEASMKPTVKLNSALSATDNFNSSSFTRAGSVSIVASGPIYQGGRLSALTRQAMAQRDAARAGLHIARHSISQNVGNAYAQLRVARAGREASDRQIRAARVAFRGVREEARVGSRTTLEVLNAEQELLDAQAGMISAITDEYVAAYTLLSAMGKMTAKHLKLPVQTYDPTAYYNLVKDAPARSKQGAKLDKMLRALGKQ